MSYWAHPNQHNGQDVRRRWEHGAGIYYWHSAPAEMSS
jgi:hypothetical protein